MGAGDKPPGQSADSVEDKVRAWRELTHPEQVAVAALTSEGHAKVDSWVPEGWKRYRSRWNRWHGHLSLNLTATEGAVCVTLETECGTIPGTGGDVGIPDTWCSLFRVHQYRQREREREEAEKATAAQRASLSPIATPAPEETLPEDYLLTPSSAKDYLAVQIPSSKPQILGLSSQDDEDLDELNLTQRMMRSQLQSAAMTLPITPTPLNTIQEAVEPTILASIAETPDKELQAQWTSRTRKRLAIIPEGVEQEELPKRNIPPSGAANLETSPIHDPYPAAKAQCVTVTPPENSISPCSEVLSYPLAVGSRTLRREQRRVRAEAVRKKLQALRQREEEEGGWYFGPPLSAQSAAPSSATSRRQKRVLASPKIHQNARNALCAHLRRDGQVIWDHGSQLAAARDDEGPLLLVFWARLKGRRVRVLVDSGASQEFVSTKCVDLLNLTVRDNGDPLNVTLADQTSSQVAFGKLTAETSVGTYSEVVKMRVLPLGIKVDIVLGGKWLRSLSPVTLDYSGWGSVKFHHKNKPVSIAGCSPGKSPSPKEAKFAMALEPIAMLSAAHAAKEIKAYRRRHSGSRSDPVGPPHDVLLAFATPAIGISMLSAVATDEDLPDADVTPEWREKFEQRCGNFKPSVIRETLPHYDDLKREDFAHIRIQAQWDGAAPNKRPYKMAMVELTQLRERLDELLSKGYIRPSSSPFAAPCLMVPKPGKPHILRLVIDYRLLNSQTVKDRYPLPDIQQLFDEMHGAKYFSSFDAVDGFWQMAMAPEDVEKTAFTSHYGSYEWLVMPMGLANSPSCYQRRMQTALGHLNFVRVFIDDCMLFSSSLEEHYEHLRIFLETCRKNGIYLKESKCQLLKTQIRVLGHVVMSREGSRPQHDKIAAIRDWSALENATHVRQFLGLAGYYRKYVLGFSELAQLLTQLTKSDVVWK
ncbi:hypothetical protein CYMTET_46839 [Cymbomonas tetramitiformis]|uniref:Reverse transcriptase domain-containing protein n=1 Tax=Cymbomonas tetramitiformis TaxID=36881 RepID=A0AAE0BWL0_9CHLO|nr:hypothetical protein CYMTET_46839 [Cymbomonas tetramitiformis]